jgi:hypothetical protein
MSRVPRKFMFELCGFEGHKWRYRSTGGLQAVMKDDLDCGMLRDLQGK